MLAELGGGMGDPLLREARCEVGLAMVREAGAGIAVIGHGAGMDERYVVRNLLRPADHAERSPGQPAPQRQWS